MTRVSDIVVHLDRAAPLSLAESWDNVGLLFGDPAASVERVLTCLTLTPDVAAEAIETGAGLIVSHHPILFRAVQRITASTTEGRVLLDLAAARVAVYSAHTRYDSAAQGINQQLAESLQLRAIVPLRPAGDAEAPSDAASLTAVGAGRRGDLSAPMTLGEFLADLKQRLAIAHLQYVGDDSLMVRRVGVACGSAAEFLGDAQRAGCQVLVTGEGRFHAALDARSRGMGLVLIGHYASERPGLERLASDLAQSFPELTVVPSAVETDPLRWM